MKPYGSRLKEINPLKEATLGGAPYVGGNKSEIVKEQFLLKRLRLYRALRRRPSARHLQTKKRHKQRRACSLCRRIITFEWPKR